MKLWWRSQINWAAVFSKLGGCRALETEVYYVRYLCALAGGVNLYFYYECFALLQRYLINIHNLWHNQNKPFFCSVHTHIHTDNLFIQIYQSLLVTYTYNDAH